MAVVSTRALWKGAISFGLVHIPVALHAATEEVRPRMRMLDAGSGAPVGYKKVDKATGEAVSGAELVKGVEVDRGQYVTLTKEEIREALPKTTQTIEIESFVRLQDVPAVYFNKPYYTSPINKGAKVYALLREVLKRTGRVGLGRVVVSTRQHLALVVPHGDGLVVNLLRWAEEIREMQGLDLPGDAQAAGLSARELQMGEQLVMDLADEWHPERFRDEFTEKVQALIEAKRTAGQVTQVAEPGAEAGAPAAGAEVIDLTDLLRRSLQARSGAPAPAAAAEPGAKAVRKPAPAKAAPRKTAQRAANEDRERAVAAAKAGDKARAAVQPRKRKSG